MASGLLGWFAAGAPAPAITDTGTIDKLFKQNRVRMMLVLTLSYGFMYTCRIAIGVLKKPMIDAGVFTPADFGIIGSALFYTYAGGKLFNGFLSDHANVKRLLAVSFLGSALCNLGMGFATTVTVAAVIWGLNGWFQGFGAPASVVGLTSWFSNRERGRAYGLWSTAHSIGEGLTFFVIGTVVAVLGWRFGYFVPAMIGIVTALITYIVVQDRPPTMGLPTVADWKNDHVEESASNKGKSLTATQFSIFAIPTVWVLALASAANYVTRYAINSWGVLYLQEARGFSLPMAGTLLAVSTMAGVVGSIIYGYVSDKFFGAKRPPANLIFALLEIAGLLVIFFGPNDLVTLVIGFLLFGLGLTGLVTSLGGLFAVDICPKRVAGAAMGFIGVFSYLGAALQENISGWLIDSHSHMTDGHRIYDFQPAIMFWVGSSIVSMLLAVTLWRAKVRD